MSSPPPSTESMIAFSYTRQGTFTGEYNDAITDNRLPGKQVEQIFNYLEDALYGRVHRSCCASCCFGFISLILLAAFSFVCIFNNKLRIEAVYFLYGCIGICVLILFCIYESNGKGLLKAGATCKQIIDYENQTLARKEIRWVIPAEFPKWIELHLDFKKKSDARNPALIINQSNPFGQQQSDLEQNRLVKNDSNAYNPPQQYN